MFRLATSPGSTLPPPQTHSCSSFSAAIQGQLDAHGRDIATTEAVMHKALERNLWVLGPEYSLFSSNITFYRQVEEMLGKTCTGDKADKRPDLLFNENLSGQYLLIEFKRPGHELNHSDYLQAIGYRYELSKYISSPI